MTVSFNSIREYFRFVGAKEYWTTSGEPQKFEEKNIVEKIGDLFVYSIHQPADGILRNIKSPVLIINAGLVASAVVTYLIYPEWTSQQIVELIPFSMLITPEIIRKVGYIFTETITFGYMTRSLGRLWNTTLMQMWSRNELRPVFIGGEVIIVNNSQD